MMKLNKKSFIKIATFVILIALGVGIGVGITSYKPIISLAKKVKIQTNPLKIWLYDTEEKRQALANFYSEISTAQDNKDWAKMYDLLPRSITTTVPKEEYVKYAETHFGNSKNLPLTQDQINQFTQKAKKEGYSDAQISAEIKRKKQEVASTKTMVHEIQVIGDKGIVDRTIVSCLTEECTGANRLEDNRKKEYVYVDGKWQMPDPEPSERALKAATFEYYNESLDDQKVFIENWGLGSSNAEFAIRQYALSLDKNLSALISEETRIEKYKADQANKPKVIYQQTPVYIPQPVYQTPDYPTHCTSNTIGSYTYTNCY